jgi:hypothetical protein
MFESTVLGIDHSEPAATWSRKHWLRHCEGYRVEMPGGALGFVETVFLSEDDEPVTIAVRTGAAETRIVLVPLDAVKQILPECEAVVLRQAGLRRNR